MVLLFLIVGALSATGQTSSTPQPITKRPAITVPWESLKPGDSIYIILNNVLDKLEIVLPDGRVVNERNASAHGFVWKVTTVSLPDGAGREFEIRVPAGVAGGEFLVGVEQPVQVHSISMDIRFRPERPTSREPMTVGPATLTPGSQTGVLVVPIGASRGPATLDIATGNSAAGITLIFPDGTRVTKASAATRGLKWEETTLAQNSQDNLTSGFGDLIAGLFFLPLAGTHQLIVFPNGTIQAGNYTVEFRSLDPRLQVFAMFLSAGL